MATLLPADQVEDRLRLARLRYRAKELSPEAQRRAADWERYATDIVAWINECVLTFDPRIQEGSKTIPFRLYDFQVETIRWLEEMYRQRRDVVIEKSRDMGASWVLLAWGAWHLIFDRDFQWLVGSRKEQFVDNWTLDSLIPKVAFILDNLPQWQRDRIGYTSACRKWMQIRVPGTGGVLSGESSNSNFSRSGRYSFVLLDEFSHWDWADACLAATADATQFRGFISTPNGINTFKKVRDNADQGNSLGGRRPSLKTLHWTLHPLKDQRWYEAECERRNDPVEVARELDISYEGSVEGKVYPEVNGIKLGDYPFVQGWPLYTSWDFGIGDATALIWWQRNPANGLWRAVDCYSNTDRTIEFYVPFVDGQIPSGLPYGYNEFEIEKIQAHAGYGPSIHYGDPAGDQRNQVTGTSVIDELLKHKVYVQTNKDVNKFGDRYHKTKQFFAKIEGFNEATCQPLVDALNNARFPKRSENHQSTSVNVSPVHNWTSHFRTAVEYMAVNVPTQFLSQAVGSNVSYEESSWQGMRR